ncbi:MAG: hypothetical protein DRH08_13345 [Deltaproteobacteria bacterium]|nr:MAG: hypothetical protein DRH08_13345 [Deltaproteobacteria bacterium]
MMKFFPLAAVLLLAGILPGMASGRFTTKIKLPSGQMVVVAEGEFEARSIGSFSIRLYQAASGENETTFFTSGFIRSRDGTIERVVLVDINDDGQPEIIVIVRSVGTGGYLSAHAFSVGKDQQLIPGSIVEGLQAEADPVAVLRESESR